MQTNSKIAVTVLAVSLAGVGIYFIQAKKIAELRVQLALSPSTPARPPVATAAPSSTASAASPTARPVGLPPSAAPSNSLSGDVEHPTLEMRQARADAIKTYTERSIAGLQKRIEDETQAGNLQFAQILKNQSDRLQAWMPDEIAAAMAGPIDLGEIKLTDGVTVTIQTGDDSAAIFTATVNADGSIGMQVDIKVLNPDGSPVLPYEPPAVDRSILAGQIYFARSSFHVQSGQKVIDDYGPRYRQLIFTPVLPDLPPSSQAPMHLQRIP